MNRFFAFALACTLCFPAMALAQEPDVAQSAPAAASSSSVSCRLGDADGFDAAEARTAARVVCAEIARAGAPPGARYRISLGKIGSATILSVAREGDTPGSTADSREIQLGGLEEVMVAAPRMAESIVKGTPMAETERVDNLVAQDTRQPKSKSGKTHFALGIVGLFPPVDQGLAAAPGLALGVYYETASQQLELGGGIRFGAGDGKARPTVPAGFFVASLGGRIYTSKTDFSPYVGGGLSWGYLDLRASSQGFEGKGNGLGAYADAGVEILRTHHTHFALGARLDLPFFSLAIDPYPAYCYPYSCGGAPLPVSFYYAPFSLELRLTF
jgi:hypothetical protein